MCVNALKHFSPQGSDCSRFRAKCLYVCVWLACVNMAADRHILYPTCLSDAVFPKVVGAVSVSVSVSSSALLCFAVDSDVHLFLPQEMFCLNVEGGSLRRDQRTGLTGNNIVPAVMFLLPGTHRHTEELVVAQLWKKIR